MRQAKLAILLWVAAIAPAKGASAEIALHSHRLERRLGLGVGAMGGPFPNPLGVTLSYNLADALRVQGTYGAGFATNLGWGHSLAVGSVFLVPGWNLSPALGIHWGRVLGASYGYDGFGRDGKNLFGSAGAEWQTDSGFTLGAGFNIPLQSKTAWTPYLRVGWSF